MKIADSDSIKSGEQELISSIMEKLNHETLSRVATKTLSPEQMEFVRGDIVIRDDRIVYKMDFKVTLDVSVMFDREGHLVDAGPDADDPDLDFDSDLESESESDGREHAFAEPGIKDEPEPYDDGEAIEEREAPRTADALPMESDMDEVLARTRDFWHQKGEEARQAPGQDGV